MKIFLLYGGKSAEHDVSIISAYDILQEIYYEYYQVVPIYITHEGEWRKGNVIKNKEEVPTLSDLRKVSEEVFDFQELKEEESVAFPVLHGPNGEDGTVKGLFVVLGVTYVGAGVFACTVVLV